MTALLLVLAVGAAPKVDHWAFKPVRDVAVPAVRDGAWSRNPIDAFLLAKLEARGWKQAAEAPKRVLLRRVYLGLTGLPPTPEEQEAFLGDKRADAYERLVSRLLASPAFGERWGRHWLDVARYADTNGYERDADKPGAWRFRDWVIAAMNEDRAYDRFIVEQLAGDEMPGATVASVVATGFLRLGPWDDEPADPVTDKFDQLDDVVAASSEAFLGMTLACARCHNHKFEPLTQVDYYRVAAVFAALRRPQAGRTELDRPAVALAGRGEWLRMEQRLRRLMAAARRAEGDEAARLRKEIAELKKKVEVPRAYVMDEVVPAPKVHVLRRGRPSLKGSEVQPGVPEIVAKTQPKFPAPAKSSNLRRLTFAKWVASKENPLTARVIVNRLWHYHFGTGLVDTPGDFGTRGGKPSHPELLDWLAGELVRSGWSLKHVHRLIVTSSAYRMSSKRVEAYAKADPKARLLWRYPYRRLEAEAIRDSILATSGRLVRTMGGPGVRPPIPAAALAGHPDPKTVWRAGPEWQTPRRTVYVQMKRSLFLPVLEALDIPDSARSAGCRVTTTVAPQALTLFNGDLVNTQAKYLAERLRQEAGEKVEAQVELLYRLLLCRPPTAKESGAVVAFVGKHGLAQACRVLYNLNEFVYPD
jgi:hypothetical protein